MEAHQVIHQPADSKFEICIGTHRALLEYSLTENSITIHHTFVPPELRGKGLAAQLADAALNFAKTTKRQVVPECDYIATYMKRIKFEQP